MDRPEQLSGLIEELHGDWYVGKRGVQAANYLLAKLDEVICYARSLESQLADLRTPKGAMENAQRVIRDAHIGAAQARDNLLTTDELIAQLDVYTEYGR